MSRIYVMCIHVMHECVHNCVMMTNINKFDGIVKDLTYYGKNDDTCDMSVHHISLTDPDAYDTSKNRIIGLGKRMEPDDAVTMAYVDDQVLNMSRNSQRYMKEYFVEKVIFNEHMKMMHELLDKRNQEGNDSIEKQVTLYSILHGSNGDEGEANYCRFIEMGLSKRPLFDVEHTDDVVVKTSDTYAHCKKKKGNEIPLEIDEWRAVMDHREHIERYFANVPVIQRFMLSNCLTMYFDTYSCGSRSSNNEKFVFLTKEIHEERATTIRVSEKTMKMWFALSEFVEIMYNRYLSKVPYTCYVTWH